MTLVRSLVVLALALAPARALAQAWVPEKGSLDVGLDYNLGVSTKIIGDKMDFADAGSTTHQMTAIADYVPIEHLGVTVDVPAIAIRYSGSKTMYPHPGGGQYDDGNYHYTLTDLRAGARYQVLEDPLAIAPYLAFSVPMVDYENVGNSVAGRHLRALHVGSSFGRLIGESSYAHLTYEFSFVQRYNKSKFTEFHNQNHTDIAVSFGHKLLDDRLDLHVDANLLITHGGVNFSEFGTLTRDELLYHDPILKEDIALVGGGAAYQLTPAWGINASLRAFVWGQNAQNANVLALGVFWSN